MQYLLDKFKQNDHVDEPVPSYERLLHLMDKVFSIIKTTQGTSDIQVAINSYLETSRFEVIQYVKILM